MILQYSFRQIILAYTTLKCIIKKLWIKVLSLKKKKSFIIIQISYTIHTVHVFSIGFSNILTRIPQFFFFKPSKSQKVKNMPAIQETNFCSLGQDDSRGGGNGNPLQYSCLENRRTEEPGGYHSLGLQRAGHD